MEVEVTVAKCSLVIWEIMDYYQESFFHYKNRYVFGEFKVEEM